MDFYHADSVGDDCEDEEYRKDIKSGDVCQHLDIKKIKHLMSPQTKNLFLIIFNCLKS